MQTFNPSSDLIPEILDRLSRADSSLASLAFEFNTTVEAFSLWMATPEIEARIASIAAAAARQIRHAAVLNLNSALALVHSVLQTYSTELTSDSCDVSHGADEADGSVPAPASRRPTAFQLAVFRERRRSNARRTAHLFLRFANFFPSSAPPAQRPAPSDRPHAASESPFDLSSQSPARADGSRSRAATAATEPAGPRSEARSSVPARSEPPAERELEPAEFAASAAGFAAPDFTLASELLNTTLALTAPGPAISPTRDPSRGRKPAESLFARSGQPRAP